MPVPFVIDKKILELDFLCVDFFKLAYTLYHGYRISVFEPLPSTIGLRVYKVFIEDFPNKKELLPILNYESCEHMRIQILHKNNFQTQNGYYISKKQLENIYPFLL